MYNMLTQLVGCTPLRKMWDLSQNVPGKCWPYHVQTKSQITVQAFVILTDWIFALLPISFLRKVQRPLRERVIIGGLMSLGIFAGVASIVKIQQLVAIKSAVDIHAHILTIEMWCSIEALTVFIASCVPCLRGQFQRTLERLGLVSLPQSGSYNYPQYPGTRYATHISSGKTTMVEPPIRMKRTTSSTEDGDSVEQIIPGNEAAKSGEIWCTTEVLMEEESMLAPKPAAKKNWNGLGSPRLLCQG